MKRKSRTFLKKFCGSTVAVAGVLATKQLLAGSVLMPPPPVSYQPAAVADDSTNNEMSVFIPSYDRRDNALPQPFSFDGITVRPHPMYDFIYGNGIQSSAGNSQSSIIQEFSPGVAVDLGRHWLVDYTPTIRFYSNRAFRNTIDHAATLSGGTSYGDWTFNLSQSYAKSDTTLADTAAQTETETFDTEIGASHELNDKFYVQCGVSQLFNFVTGQQDSKTWSTMDWLNYEYNKRLNFGVGLGGGYVLIDGDSGSGDTNPDQAFQQFQGRVQWRAMDKLSFSVNAGLEERELLASGYKDELNPTFGASIEYQPFEHTQVTLGAGRTVSSSDYSILAQTTENTSVNLSVNQEFFKDYTLSAGVGYTQTAYTLAIAELSLSNIRTDDNYNFNVRLSRTFFKRGNVAVTYQYTDNASSQTGFAYHSNQIGFQIGFAY